MKVCRLCREPLFTIGGRKTQHPECTSKASGLRAAGQSVDDTFTRPTAIHVIKRRARRRVLAAKMREHIRPVSERLAAVVDDDLSPAEIERRFNLAKLRARYERNRQAVA